MNAYAHQRKICLLTQRNYENLWSLPAYSLFAQKKHFSSLSSFLLSNFPIVILLYSTTSQSPIRPALRLHFWQDIHLVHDGDYSASEESRGGAVQ